MVLRPIDGRGGGVGSGVGVGDGVGVGRGVGVGVGVGVGSGVEGVKTSGVGCGVEESFLPGETEVSARGSQAANRQVTADIKAKTKMRVDIEVKRKLSKIKRRYLQKVENSLMRNKNSAVKSKIGVNKSVPKKPYKC